MKKSNFEVRLKSLTHEQFLADVRSGLNHLYDPDQLRRSPLVTLFQLAGRLDAPAALQSILLDAIEKLKPSDSEPPQSHAWLIYDILYFRYVQSYDRERVASQLGFSGRQFSREQLTALETLSLWLWKTYAIDSRASAPPVVLKTETSSAEPGPASAWLKDIPPEKHTSLAAALPSILELVRPLARQWQVELNVPPAGSLPDCMVAHFALRHALLNILGVGIPLSNQGRVTLSIQEQPGAIDISIECARGTPEPAALGEKEKANLAIARELAQLNRGSFESHLEGQTLRVRLALPVSKPLVVLAIDDNADILQLYQRYAQGTRYTIVGLQNPAEALELAGKLLPHIILIDVMMPEIDGWDLLMRLREDPRTSFVPIVVCTILPQEGLAHSLGANAFLQKPVLPEAFLAVLDKQMEFWK